MSWWKLSFQFLPQQQQYRLERKGRVMPPPCIPAFIFSELNWYIYTIKLMPPPGIPAFQVIFHEGQPPGILLSGVWILKMHSWLLHWKDSCINLLFADTASAEYCSSVTCNIFKRWLDDGDHFVTTWWYTVLHQFFISSSYHKCWIHTLLGLVF